MTVLFGGLTPAHERLFKALLVRRGFRVEVLPTPSLEDYAVGRRYGNNGFCNPLYFMSGSLINHLRRIEADGMSRSEVCERHVYLTTRSAGPCRLGLYQQEYRHVLDNAGYGDVRVVAFEDAVSLRGADSEEGLPFDASFYDDLILALMLGDVLNDLYYRTIPYERCVGATDAAWQRSLALAETRLARASWFTRAIERLPVVARSPLLVISRAAGYVFDPSLIALLARMRREFSRVEVDLSRLRPRVKLIGEFWAQTTQGDGNYRVQRFLAAHCAEVSIEPVSTWVMYLLFEAEQGLQAKLTKIRFATECSVTSVLRAAIRSVPSLATVALYRCAELLYRFRYNLIRAMFSRVPDTIPSIRELARLAAPYYNPGLFGGEAHMEIGKTLYNTLERRVHMVISVKPFGCLPSTMSDGVQPLVRAHHPSTLFLAIETSSEGSTHAQSRILMVLSEARRRARSEYGQALETSGLTEEEAIGRLAARHALDRVPHDAPIAALAARALLAASTRSIARRILTS